MKTFLKIHGKVICVLGLVFLLVACSSVGKTQITQPKTGQIRPNTTVILSVIPPKNASDQEEVTDVIRRLKSQLFGRLMSEGLFKQVFHPGESADYRMDVQLLETNKVSQGARIFLGVFAGKNFLKAKVSLYEERSQSLVTSFDVTGKSASHPFSSENDLDDAIREFVDQIILTLNN
jgi:hypothetical protein